MSLHSNTLSRRLILGISFLIFSLVTGLCADSATIQLKPDELKWVPSPAMHGLKTAVLAGNPAAAGPYVERIIIPPNSRLLPHSHPNQDRMVTVLSGTLYFAFGDNFDEAKLVTLPTGSFFTEPANTAHYSLTRSDGAVLELHAIGPAGTTYVTASAIKAGNQDKAVQEIESLLGYLTGLSGAVFVRNGVEYSSKDATAHLRKKWEMQKGQIKSAEDFIALCATKSSMSGQSYSIRMSDGKTIETAVLLKERLAANRTQNQTGP